MVMPASDGPRAGVSGVLGVSGVSVASGDSGDSGVSGAAGDAAADGAAGLKGFSVAASAGGRGSPAAPCQPVVDEFEPVRPPERLAIDHDEGRPEDAAVDAGGHRLAQVAAGVLAGLARGQSAGV